MPTNDTTFLFEKFEIIECLKKDAYSGVYLANHIYLGKKIILKTLDTENLRDKTVFERFKREAKILAKLDHPNIIKVLDFGTYGKDFYISFEYFDSLNLRQTIQKRKLDDEQKIHLTRQLFRGLGYAHQNHIVHRDIKPENILVNTENRLKIADFGLALVLDEDQITQKTSIVGTPGYMSPEQIRGEALSSQSDLFSAGIVGYELFNGKNPFLGKDAGETINNILKSDVSKLIEQGDDIPPAVRPLLQQTLRRERRYRAKSAGEVLQLFPGEIQEELTHAEAAAPAGKKSYRPWIFAILLIGILLTAAAFIFQNTKNEAEPKPLQLRANSGSVADQPSVPADTFIASTDENPADEKLMVENTADNNPVDENLRLTGQSDSKSGEKMKPVENPLEASRQTLLHSNPADVESISENPNLPGSLLIYCLPWADVYIDGNKVDTTPLKKAIQLQPGDYALRLSHPQYPAYSHEITISPEEQLQVSVDLDTLFGYLNCKIYPWGEIQVDGESRGQTPLKNPLILTPGSHLLTIVNPQFDNFEETINIVRGDTLLFQMDFESLDNK